MNINELKAKATTAQETKVFTLSDIQGKQAILALPIGLFECIIKDIPSTADSKSIRLIVETTDKHPKTYAVSINIGNSAQSAEIFLNTMSHLMKQLDLGDTFDLDTLKTKVGSTICVAGIERTTDSGTFTNYSFNPAILAKYL